MPDKMGRAGSADAEHRAYRAGAPGEFPPGYRMGGVHRRRDPGAEYAGSPDRVYFMGQPDTKKGPDVE